MILVTGRIRTVRLYILEKRCGFSIPNSDRQVLVKADLEGNYGHMGVRGRHICLHSWRWCCHSSWEQGLVFLMTQAKCVPAMIHRLSFNTLFLEKRQLPTLEGSPHTRTSSDSNGVGGDGDHPHPARNQPQSRCSPHSATASWGLRSS